MKEITKIAKQEAERFSSIKIKTQSHEKLRYMAKLLNAPMSDLISEFTDKMFELLFTFKSIDSIEYERSSLSNTLEISAYGEKRIFTSSINEPEDATDEKIFKDIFSLKLERELEK